MFNTNFVSGLLIFEEYFHHLFDDVHIYYLLQLIMWRVNIFILKYDYLLGKIQEWLSWQLTHCGMWTSALPKKPIYESSVQGSYEHWAVPGIYKFCICSPTSNPMERIAHNTASGEYATFTITSTLLSIKHKDEIEIWPPHALPSGQVLHCESATKGNWKKNKVKIIIVQDMIKNAHIYTCIKVSQ